MLDWRPAMMRDANGENCSLPTSPKLSIVQLMPQVSIEILSTIFELFSLASAQVPVSLKLRLLPTNIPCLSPKLLLLTRTEATIVHPLAYQV